MKKLLPFSVAFSALASTCLPVAMNAQTTSEGALSSRKNVLFIAVDDLKPLLGCYGDPIAQTPHIDRLAARGTIFASAYCQQAVSAATRASQLTGMCPDRTRLWDLKTLIRSQNPDVVTLPQYFKEKGYTVAGIGKIYDPRSVDKQQDARSWSEPYMEHAGFVNAGFEQPVMAQYQSREVRDLYNKYVKEAQAQGIEKKNQIEKYVQKYV